ncbi:MAG: hypothetical protein AAFR39_06945 [Pseudomonadota bacterium]
MTEEDAKAALREIVAKDFPEALELPDFWNLMPGDIGYDSLDESQLALEFSDMFGLDMVPDDIEGLTFGKLIKVFLEAKS